MSHKSWAMTFVRLKHLRVCAPHRTELFLLGIVWLTNTTAVPRLATFVVWWPASRNSIICFPCFKLGLLETVLRFSSQLIYCICTLCIPRTPYKPYTPQNLKPPYRPPSMSMRSSQRAENITNIIRGWRWPIAL